MITRRLRFSAKAGAFLLVVSYALAQDAPLPPVVQFNRDVRPILSDKCFTCHGPDKNHRQTEFRFDVEESAKSDIGDGRHAIIPGDLQNSVLIQKITAADPGERMPPPAAPRKLSDRDIALLKEWIQQGAKWEKPWSFVPPQRPTLPKVIETSWVRNPIDNFILQRLEDEKLKPSPEADRATLLRRVMLDLAGRGPTLKELDAFLSDKSPNAYEKVVEKLLASPEYGERMALPWLDASRYADSDGYQIDAERYMWRWRDWVINAFNKNMPYDQFALEQLAGDLLPNPTLDQKIATGFNRNHRTNGEGGIVPEEFAAEYVVDRVATTSSVFLGLTMGCARCHDHKYDPFTQKEFYQLFAYFNNIPELGRSRKGNSDPYMKAPTPEQQDALKKFDDEIAAVSTKFAKLQLQLNASEAAWLKTIASDSGMQWAPSRGITGYYPLDGSLEGNTVVAGAGKTAPVPNWKGNAQYAKGILGQAANFNGSNFIDAGDVGGFDDNTKITLSAWIYPTAADGAIITKTPDAPEEKGYEFQLRNGKLFFNAAFRWIDHAIRVESEKTVELNRWHHVAVTYSGGRAARDLTMYLDGEPQKLKILMDILNETARVREPMRIGGGGGPENRFHGLIEQVRVYNTELSPEEVGILSVSKSLDELAAIGPAQRTQAESNKIRSAFLYNSAAPADAREAYQQLTKLQSDRAQYWEGVSTVMVMEEMPKPRESHILLRGSYDAPGDIVTPNVPAILPAMPADYPRNRLGLAKWIVSPTNPLTARVAVNRYWQMYFGTGIVKTVDDFGSQGEAPSHPELLDWLATEFLRTNWNIKAMQRLIVTSATYRQASKATPEMVERDPENRLLARGPRYRLPAELVRDEVLSISGLMVEKVGGPSVKIYQPEGLWTDLTQNQSYVQDHGEKLYRRSLYTYWKRTIPPPFMANFDAPSRESCILQRGLTNSPLQALDLMNDVAYLEAARLLGERMIKEGGASADDRIAFAFRLATGRAPTAKENQILSSALHYSLDRFQTRPEAAETYLKEGEYPRDPKLDAKELAAYSSVASLIINFDETLTKE